MSARPLDGTQDFCYVTTVGRRTGEPHTIEIWFGANARTLYLLSGGGEAADWVKNIRRESRVRVRVGESQWEGVSRVVADPLEEALARRLLASKYQDWRDGSPLSDWARTALPIAIDLPAEAG